MARKIVLLDNNVLDQLKLRKVDLPFEAGEDLDFRVSDLGMLEIPPENHSSEDARSTSAYAHDQLAKLATPPVGWLRLRDISEPSSGSGGFGDLQPDGTVSGGGYMTTVEGRVFVNDPTRHKPIGGPNGDLRRPTGLLKSQTDVDYGEWSMGFPLVTINTKDFKHAGMIIDLSLWGNESFGDFIRRQLALFSY